MAGGWVKQIDKDKFYGSLEMFLSGNISLCKAAEMVGLSVPTLRKYYEIVITGKKLPENLFKDEN